MKTLNQLINDLSLEIVQGDGDTLVTDLRDDSRLVEPGCLFVARDRKYIESAIDRGATAVITDQAPDSDLAGDQVIWIQSSTTVDQRLAGILAERFFDHPSQALSLIGLTGTNGKTTTAMLIEHLLIQAGVKCGLIGTVFIDDGDQRLAAELTTPGAIDFSRYLAAMVRNGCTAAVAEMSSHGLHQGRTASLDVDVAVFTNLTGDHLDYHEDIESYAAAKAILFDQLAPTAWAIVNADDSHSDRMLRDCQARAVHCRLTPEMSPNEDAINCQALALNMAAGHSRVRFDGPWGSVEVNLPLVGRHNIANTLQAIAAADAVTAMARYLRDSLKTCPPVPGRLEPVESDSASPMVLVDYAHTHDALENVLTALRQVMPKQGSRLITMFGCGGDRDKSKRPLMAEVACRLSDTVIITSDNPRTEDPAAIIDGILEGAPDSIRGNTIVEPDRRKAIQHAIQIADRYDVVLLAGKGHEDYQIIGTTKHHFDDREEAAAVLKSRVGPTGATAA